MNLASIAQISSAQRQAKEFIKGHPMWDNSDGSARRAVAEFILQQQNLTMYELVQATS